MVLLSTNKTGLFSVWKDHHFYFMFYVSFMSYLLRYRLYCLFSMIIRILYDSVWCSLLKKVCICMCPSFNGVTLPTVCSVELYTWQKFIGCLNELCWSVVVPSNLIGRVSQFKPKVFGWTLGLDIFSLTWKNFKDYHLVTNC